MAARLDAAGFRLGIGSETRKALEQGTQRVVAPGATLARTAPLLSRAGITRVANVTGLDRIGIPVVMVVRPNARSVAVSQGKGLTLEAAKASGVMEALELHHAETANLPLRHASAAELTAEFGSEAGVLDLDRVQRERDSEISPNLKMLWVCGQALPSGAPIWLPYELVHADYTDRRAPGPGIFMASTNGLASGNHPLEAVVHGLCEVIERDATVDWAEQPRSERKARRLDLDSVDDPACRDLIRRFEAADIALAVWETTSRVGIAAFECLIADARSDGGHSARSAGCHPLRAVALARALTEAAQVRATYIAAARDDLSTLAFETERTRERSRAARALIEEGTGRRSFAEAPNRPAETLEADLRHILDRLAAVGLHQVAAVDLTNPAFGLPVWRVVVPGLRIEDEGAEPAVEAAPRPLRRLHLPEAEGYFFVGPSLPRETVEAFAEESGLVALPPARQGDILRAAKRRPRAIGLIDGVFDGSTAPWHKEILWALEQGVAVFGAASMGALRAAELHPFGMRGIGRIFAAFRDGQLEDDDEVAVLHGPAEVGYRPLTEAMVSLRDSLAKARQAGVLEAATAESLTALAKASFYQERSLERIFESGAAHGLPRAELEALRAWWDGEAVDTKREDAAALLESLGAFLAEPEGGALPAGVEVERSDAWSALLAEAGRETAETDEAALDPWILDEVRLGHEDFSSLQAAALLRRLSLNEAERQGISVDSGRRGEAFRLFREERELFRMESVRRWVEENALAAEAFDSLIEDEAKLALFHGAFARGAPKEAIDQLRLSGRYSAFRIRAERKRARLSELGYADPSPEDIVHHDLLGGAALPLQRRRAAMLAWYFNERIKIPMPENLERFAVGLGLENLDEFYRFITREFIYLTNS